MDKQNPAVPGVIPSRSAGLDCPQVPVGLQLHANRRNDPISMCNKPRDTGGACVKEPCRARAIRRRLISQPNQHRVHRFQVLVLTTEQAFV